jgi:D-lactate dehydrogenase
MKILVTEINEIWQQQFLSQQLPNHNWVFTAGELNLDVVNQHPDTDVLCVFIGSLVNQSVIDKLPQLKFLTTRSTGYEHIDLEVARLRGVVVSNVPFYGENTVAEHAMALLLGLSRNLRPSFQRIEEAKFEYEGLRGWDLKGKRLGIIGGGHIGMHIARMAKGFEMEVFAYDMRPDQNIADSIGFRYLSLEELLKTSDVISLHLPLNEHTIHFIDQPQFDQMKNGAFIINTARGGLINTAALVSALKSGKLGGAGLDVLEEEEFLKHEDLQLLNDPNHKDKLLTILENHILMQMDNVIITPHNAFNSKEALERILDATVINIKTFSEGKAQNVVA